MWNQNEPHQNNSKPFKKIHLKDTCSSKYNNPQQQLSRTTAKPFKKIHLKDTCSNKYNNPQHQTTNDKPNNKRQTKQLFQEPTNQQNGFQQRDSL
jgi:ribosomal protein L44E